LQELITIIKEANKKRSIFLFDMLKDNFLSPRAIFCKAKVNEFLSIPNKYKLD